MKYVFSNTRACGGVKAEDAAKELERIHGEQGVLTAQSVVDEARPEDAVLHPAFEWRDAVAGEEWRKHQARTLIRSVRVQYDGATEAAPIYYNVRTAGDQTENPSGYQPISVLIKDRSQFESALSLLRDSLAHSDRALSALVAAMDEATNQQKEAVSTASGAIKTALEAAESIGATPAA